MTGLFLAPHNDDETLFGAYTLLRHRPFVVVVLRSFVEAEWVDGPDYETRERETDAAMKVLGCEWEQWPIGDDAPDWEDVVAQMGSLDPEWVWAPQPEEGGHEHHNWVGMLASARWPGRVTHYLTYTHTHGRSVSDMKVATEPGWDKIKQAALDCYATQKKLGPTSIQFRRPLEEYYAL